MTWKCQIDKYDEVRYIMILGRDLLTPLGLEPTFSECIVEGEEGPYEGWSVPMVDVYDYYIESVMDKFN